LFLAGARVSEILEIKGGIPLKGTIRASGAKNAALPVLIASLLTDHQCIVRNVPNLKDVHLTLQLLQHFGAVCSYSGDTVKVQTERLRASEASFSLVKALRASFWVLGPLLARGRAARVALPGGDVIGARPVDMHLEALTQMGADIRVKHGTVIATAVNGLRASEITLRFPSVGATHQLLMAMALTPGRSVLRGVAREPEIDCLCDFLVTLGAELERDDRDCIIVNGQEQLRGAEIDLIGDRIEASTYLLAAIASGGEVTIDGINPKFFGAFLEILAQMNVGIATRADSITARYLGSIKPVTVRTGPFPQFATDLQALVMAAVTLAEGESTIEETIFEGRFSHVSELCRMGAKIKVSDRTARIQGVSELSAARVEAFDIRAGAALIIAAVAAEGTTSIHETHHIRRGYSLLENKLESLGASLFHRYTDPEDYMFTGC